MHQAKGTAILYGILHFLVDFCCAFFMFSVSKGPDNCYVGYLIYNFLAFAMQMPVGLVADRIRKNVYTAVMGCFMILATLILVCFKSFLGEQAVLWTGLSLIGLGNCFFHVGGGIEVMKRSQDKAAPLGIFVSPGAIGIFLGTTIGKNANRWYLFPMILGLGAGIVLLLIKSREYHENSKCKLILEACERNESRIVEAGDACCLKERMLIGFGALFCFFLVVVLRSYLGMIAVFPWKDTLLEGLLALMGVFAGKLLGGILADKFGINRTVGWSLMAAAICFFFSDYMFGGVMALFFFNMSMPVTLFLAGRVLKGNNGFAFGILTFAIFIGFLPAYAGITFCNRYVLTILAVLSLVLIEAGIYLQNFSKPHKTGKEF